EATVADPEARLEDGIENIDIGGPAMLRAAAKNHEYVTVVTDPGDYADLVESLREQDGTLLEQRRRYAARAFAHTARYDGLIADWLCRQCDRSSGSLLGPTLHVSMQRHKSLRYGENPHQMASLYLDVDAPDG